MKRLKIEPGLQCNRLRRVLLAALFVPIVLTGFISMPSDKSESSENSLLDIEVLIEKVVQLNQQKEHQKAIDFLLEVIDKQKEDPLLKALLVQTFDLFLEDEVRQGQREIEKDHYNQSAYNRLAGALELLGDNFRAMEVLLNGVQFNSKSTDLWMRIARLELNANRDMEALDVFREVIRLNNKHGDAYNNAAYVLASLENGNARDLNEAEQLAINARKLDPKNAEYIDTLAEVHFKQGNLKMAQTLIEEAIKLSPKKEEFKEQLEKFRRYQSSMQDKKLP